MTLALAIACAVPAALLVAIGRVLAWRARNRRQRIASIIQEALAAQHAYEIEHGKRQAHRLSLMGGLRGRVAKAHPAGYDHDQRVLSVQIRVRSRCAALGLVPPKNLLELIEEAIR